MANQSTQKRTSSNTRKTTTGTKKTSSRSQTSTRKNTNSNSSRKPVQKKTVEPAQVGFKDYFHAFTKTKMFVPIATIFAIVLIVLLDVLFAWNNYDRFFFILGIELIIFAAINIGSILMKLGNDVMQD